MSSGSGDLGEADPRLVAAVAGGDATEIREVMLTSRILVPILALGAESTGAEMAVPRLIGADGRHALPIFSCYETLRAWQADARPVPMVGEEAVVAALGEGYAALVLDVAGPTPQVFELRGAEPA